MKLLMILVCKGTCGPVAPPLKGQGDSVPVMHPRSGVPVAYMIVRLVHSCKSFVPTGWKNKRTV